MIDSELYKERSYAGCIGAAFELLCTNFATIFRRTWLPALMTALIGSLGVLMPLHTVAVPADITPFFLSLGLQFAVVLLSLAAFAWMNSGLFTLLNEASRRTNLLRCLASTGLVFATFVVLFLLIVGAGFALILSKYGATPASMWTILGAFSLVFLVLAVVMFVVYVPAIYSATRYLIVGDCSVWSVFGKSYAKGWHSWGFLAIVTFLVLLISAIVSVVAGVPQITLVLAEQVDNFGVTVLGDASDVPGSFLFLRYMVSVLTGFALLYLCIWCELVGCFAYGRVARRALKTPETPDNARQ